MRKPRVFQAIELVVGQQLHLTSEASLHVAKVLRLTRGHHLLLFNGNGYDYDAIITQVTKNQVSVELLTATRVNSESCLSIHLGQAIPRQNKMDLVIQKAVELGLTEFTPLISERCQIKLSPERWQKKMEHWHKVMVSACEQSGRAKLLKLNEPTAINHWITHCQIETRLILHPHFSQSEPTTIQGKAIALLVGPEGGFVEEEVSIAQQHQFAALKLGPRILRTETAAIAALSVLQAQHGDLLA